MKQCTKCREGKSESKDGIKKNATPEDQRSGAPCCIYIYIYIYISVIYIYIESNTRRSALRCSARRSALRCYIHIHMYNTYIQKKATPEDQRSGAPPTTYTHIYMYVHTVCVCVCIWPTTYTPHNIDTPAHNTFTKYIYMYVYVCR